MKKFGSWLFTLIALILSCVPVGALSAQPANSGNWLIWFGNARISQNWSIWNEIQVRQYNVAGDMEQLMLRAAVNYHTKNGVWISQGYGRINTWKYIPGSDTKSSFWEHRSYQQLLLRQTYDGVFLTHRYRMEERFFQNKFELRFRYFLSANIPLNLEKMEPGAVYLSAYSEIFLREKRSNDVFDRNRLYGGLGYVLNKDVRLEAAWMEQQFQTSRRGQLQLVVFKTFDVFSKNINR